MDTERQKVIFMPFQIILCLSPNVHINVALNGIIIITFSIHSVVSFFFPFTVSQMLQPPITLDNGFIHRSLFRRVLNKMSEVTKHKRNNLRNNADSLKVSCHTIIAAFHPFPTLIGRYAYKGSQYVSYNIIEYLNYFCHLILIS